MPQANAPLSANPDIAINDLGPLAWVLDELRKSLDASSKALRRFVRDAEIARGSDLAALDSSQLRIARQQVHQAVGALEMVGFEAPAMILRAMESAIQKFIQKPEHCSDDAAAKVERAGFALTGYLEGVLAGRGASPVSLFPQYLDVQTLAGASRIHPADLWSHDWRLREVALATAPAIALAPDVRAKFDQGVLKIVRSFDADAAAQLRDLSIGLSFGEQSRASSIFWKIASGYFDALAHGLLVADMHTKRAASRVLVQFSAQAGVDPSSSDRLSQDLLFFCAQAVPAAGQAQSLTAVRLAYGLSQSVAVDYSKSIFGQFDPSLLAQARKRLNIAKETWSLVTAGDVSKFKALVDQFSLVNDSLTKLLPSGAGLALALSRCAEASAKSSQGPQPALSMEVATALLYVEAVFEDLDPNDSELARRSVRLAERVDSVRDGKPADPLESWMEELYRKVSDKQTMGSVVGELKHNLAELEKSMDQFFRNPKDKTCLRDVPSQLAQMRGVMSVLGIDQASVAVLRMRDSVEQILVTEIDEERARATGTFDKLGNSLGALGFLIDMLSYQPVLAKKLFIFDEELGELRPLMGRTVGEHSVQQDKAEMAFAAEQTQVLPVVAAQVAGKSLEPVVATIASSAAISAAAPAPAPALALYTSTAQEDEDADAELKEIFLDEAREVAEQGLAAVQELAQEPSDVDSLTTLRRAFHTLKGSSRMVGLNEFGEAGWAMEQLLNAWLAEQKPASEPLLTLTSQAMGGFSVWIEAISADQAEAFSAKPFKRSADAMRLEGRFEALVLEESIQGAQPKEPLLFTSVPAPITEPVVEIQVLAAEPLVDSHAEVIDIFDFEFPAEPAVLTAATADQTLSIVQLPEQSAGELSPEAVEIDFDSISALTVDAAQAQLVSANGSFEPSHEPMPELASEPMDFVDFDVQSTEPMPLMEGTSFDETPPAMEFDSAGFDFSPQAASVAPVSLVDTLSAPAVMSVSAVAVAALATQILPQAEPKLRLVGGPDTVEIPSLTESIPAADEQFKAIGPLRIGIALYNVYLNEADEWSRRLLTELSEWSIETLRALPDSSVSLAHSLAGSSATVGFSGLSALSRSLEHRLQASQAYSEPQAAHRHAAAFVRVAEEIRRLLHQFAAGFLKDANPEVLQLLQDTEQSEITDIVLTSAFGSLSVEDNRSEALHAVSQYADEPLAVTFVEQISAPAIPTAHETVQAAAPHEMQIDESVAAQATDDDSEIARLEALLAEHANHLELPPLQDAPIDFDSVVPDEMYVKLDAAGPVAMHAPQSTLDSLTEPMSPKVGEPESIVSIQGLAVDSESTPVAASTISHAPEALIAASLAGITVAAFSASSTTSEEGLKTVSMPQSAQIDDADDIDAVDALDPDLFPIFDEEAAELMPQLGTALRQWTEKPANQDARSEVLRVLHTLKGSARLAGAMRLGEMTHRIESEIESLGSQDVASASVEPLLAKFDTMSTVLDALRHAPIADNIGLAAVAVTSQSGELALLASQADTALSAGVASPVTTSSNTLSLVPRGLTASVVIAANNQSVRVRSQLLDRLVNQAGEVMITRARLESEMNQLRGSLGDLTANLDKLRVQLRDIEVQAESQMQSRMAQAKESSAGFDPLEFDRFTRVQELTRMMAESVNDVATVQRNLQRTVDATEDDLVAQARQTRELQRDLLRTRMVEFEGISERLYRVVRQASKDAGKIVKLDITGGSIEMDRGVLDRMTPAFEHLLRNCVAHGIEDADTRTAGGKAASGQITISLHQEGNDVSVEFRDDGAGLNLARIRDKAVSQGLLAFDQNLTDNDAANLIFTPGFSTATQVTELSGRGIGMDVVRSEINALGGRIETSTSAGQGTNFKLVLPLTTAVTQVVMLRMGNLTIGVPANLVEIVRRTPTKELEQAYNTGLIGHGGQEVAFYWSGALLQASRASDAPMAKTTPIVVFRSAAQRVAMHVDEVLGNQEVVVKNLGSQLSRLPGLAGMSVLASGAVVLIYNPVALATVYGEQARQLSADKAEPHVLEAASVSDPLREAAIGTSPELPAHLAMAQSRIPVVLVVDDSITVRRVTQRLLVREGYKVVLAADGLQAIEKLAQEVPTLVVSDIEMPRMDGFDLVRNIRGDVRLVDLPVVMITSRMGEKHREHAISLGANHYLGKPYSEEELLSLVRRYAELEASKFVAA